MDAVMPNQESPRRHLALQRRNGGRDQSSHVGAIEIPADIEFSDDESREIGTADERLEPLEYLADS
jgi:hypothetical protein